LNYLLALFLLIGGKKKKNKMSEKEQVEQYLSQLEEELERIKSELLEEDVKQELLSTPEAYHSSSPEQVASRIAILQGRKQYLERAIGLARGRLDTMRRDPEKFKY